MDGSPNVQEIEAFIASLPIEEANRQPLVEALKSQQDDLSNEKTRASLACKINQAVFRGEDQYVDAITNKEHYTDRTQANWSKLCWNEPACFVAPKDANEVGVALKIITFLQTKFAIRAGGHAYNPGWASVGSNGVLIDLHNMRQLELCPDKCIVSVGPGNKWNDVYDFLGPSNLTVVGGRQGPVGVSGLILGGGLSYLSNREGLACDNVKNFEVVLADSTVVSANAHEHPDLFYALKGGGSNFGIVTRLDLYTKPYDKIYFEMVHYDPSETDNLLRALADLQHDPNTGSIFVASPQATVVGLVYLEPTMKPEAFSKFYTIPNVTTYVPATIGGHSQLIKTVDGLFDATTKARQDAVAASVMADGDLYIEMYRRGREMSKTLEEKTGTGLNLVFQQVSKTAVEKGHQLGKNPFGMLAQPQTWFTAAATWQDAAHDETVHEVLHDLGTSMKELADAKGLSNPQLFPNDSTFSQNPMESFGKQVLGELQATSRKFDPELVFQKLQNGGFKLGMV